MNNSPFLSFLTQDGWFSIEAPHRQTEELTLDPRTQLKNVELRNLPNLHTVSGHSDTLVNLIIHNCPKLVIPSLEAIAPNLNWLEICEVKHVSWHNDA